MLVPPYDNSGNVIPVSGISPVIAAIFITTCAAIHANTPTAISPSSDGKPSATFMIFNSKTVKHANIAISPTNPNVSPITAKTESLIDSGKYPVACTLFPTPTPINPPVPIAIIALSMWYEESALPSPEKVISLSSLCGEIKIEATPQAPIATKTITKSRTFTPLIHSIANTIAIRHAPVPKSFCNITTKNNDNPITMINGIQKSLVSNVPAALCCAIKSARYKISDSFRNSAGCKLNEPKFIHLQAPS